jgi:UDP-N-acetylglucosamine 2-epimerase (non-hydrolysing)
MQKLSKIFTANKIDAAIVQGDTTTSFCGALCAFYNKVPVFHVEAGIRTFDLNEPYPEEALRQMTARIASLHFAPTQISKNNLIKENIPSKDIYVVGNTSIDALKLLNGFAIKSAQNALKKQKIEFNKDLVLITIHRRENQTNGRLDSILQAIRKLAQIYVKTQFIIPVHPNPNVKNRVHSALKGLSNTVLLSPLDDPKLICLIKNAKLIITDSGGIQEEAPSFGVPVLVVRYKTEREEAVKAGFAKLVGADKNLIVCQAQKVLSRSKKETCIKGIANPYGNGKTSQKIIKIIENYFI